MDFASPMPATLLIHDGELADVRDLLVDLGVEFGEHDGPPTPEQAAAASDLLIATAKRMLELAGEPFPRRAVRIAVLGSDSRTLRTMLQRAGIDLVVRRPVHPAALRLLILHSLYRGPEKRKTKRVLVGFPVHFRTGLRRREAMLIDLSLSGCRLVTERPLDPGKRIAIQLPTDVGGGRPLAVTGHVVRVRRADEFCHGRFELAISFDLTPDVEPRLRNAVRTHSVGPAVLQAHPPVESPGSGPQPAGERGPLGVDAAPGAAPEPAEAEAASSPGEAAAESAPPERRVAPRHALHRHFVALAEEATRVLIGRDISLGGMRIDPHPSLSIGDELSIAVHLCAREEPMVIQARVERDDGHRGMLLHFLDLPEASAERLIRMVDLLPILAVDEATEASKEVVVTKILELEAS